MTVRRNMDPNNKAEHCKLTVFPATKRDVPMMSDERERLREFLRPLPAVPWLSRAGDSFPDGVVVTSITEGWDDWNDEMMAVWRSRSEELESTALQAIGDQGIDEVFAEAANVTGPPIEMALRWYLDHRQTISDSDRGLWPDVLETMKRDVAWAAIENVLGRVGFFTSLMAYYRNGRWPCSWEGKYPEGRIVVL